MNFLWFFRAETPSEWSSVVCQMSPAVANQMGLITAGFQLFLPSLPYSPTPGLCSIAFSILLDTDIYKRDFAVLGNYSKRQSMGKHTYPPLVSCTTFECLYLQAIQCSLSYLCDLLFYSLIPLIPFCVDPPHCKHPCSVFHTEPDTQSTFTVLVSVTYYLRYILKRYFFHSTHRYLLLFILFNWKRIWVYHPVQGPHRVVA